MRSDFKLFQKMFLKYQKLFGVTGYKVYFKHEPFDDAYADICVQQADMIATVRLNSKKADSFSHVEQSAKHEAIHLLLFRLEDRAIDRFARQSDIYESVEEVVFKLEHLIPDLKVEKNGS